MNIILLVPKVVSRYVASFPDMANNAYKYFNYDHRVVNERVERGDYRAPYMGPNDFGDADYDALVRYAKEIADPILLKYSVSVACDDAMHRAIRSFENGVFDGKVNSSRYPVLVGALKGLFSGSPVMAKGKSKKEPAKKPQVLKQRQITELGLKTHKLPTQEQKGVKGPQIIREKGKAVLKTPE